MSELTAKQSYWSEHLQQANAYDGSFTQYARSQDISLQSLYRWRRYFSRSSTPETNPTPSFTQIIQSPAPDCCIKLQLGQMRVQFADLPDPLWLAEFMTASQAS